MGSNGRGPKPYTQRQAWTLFVRVPLGEWPLVKRGHKREFRNRPGESARMNNVTPPVPIVAFCFVRGKETYDARLMLLERFWEEQLGAISGESLRAEGYDDFAQFRRAWIRRYRDGRKFKPTERVWVYRVRPWEPGDEAETAVHIFRHLYGEWLP